MSTTESKLGYVEFEEAGTSQLGIPWMVDRCVVLELRRESSSWNGAWSLCMSLQLIAQGPFLTNLLWKLLEVRDEGQISLNPQGAPQVGGTQHIIAD